MPICLHWSDVPGNCFHDTDRKHIYAVLHKHRASWEENSKETNLINVCSYCKNQQQCLILLTIAFVLQKNAYESTVRDCHACLRNNRVQLKLKTYVCRTNHQAIMSYNLHSLEIKLLLCNKVTHISCILNTASQQHDNVRCTSLFISAVMLQNRTIFNLYLLSS